MSPCATPTCFEFVTPTPTGNGSPQTHPGGTLAQRLDLFKGDLPRALKALRGLVAGVARLHAGEAVHRDIKPQNIFISATGELVLGDFGLVFFNDDHRTRLSATLENVGTRDWMPPWAVGMRLENVTPTFDVFSLGKVLGRWSRVIRFCDSGTGKSRNSIWSGFFRTAHSFGSRGGLLSKCVVEEETDCLPDAGAARGNRPDDQHHSCGGNVIGDGIERQCRVCGVGKYLPLSNNDIDNSFRRPAGVRVLKAFTCDHCGHVQMFLFPNDSPFPAWRGPK